MMVRQSKKQVRRSVSRRSVSRKLRKSNKSNKSQSKSRRVSRKSMMRKTKRMMRGGEDECLNSAETTELINLMINNEIVKGIPNAVNYKKDITIDTHITNLNKLISNANTINDYPISDIISIKKITNQESLNQIANNHLFIINNIINKKQPLKDIVCKS
jgi:hypothetical protein